MTPADDKTTLRQNFPTRSLSFCRVSVEFDIADMNQYFAFEFVSQTKTVSMLTEIHPKLPMRDKTTTRKFYEKLGFQNSGGDYDGYLMIKKDHIQIHFFEFKELNPLENYGP